MVERVVLEALEGMAAPAEARAVLTDALAAARLDAPPGAGDPLWHFLHGPLASSIASVLGEDARATLVPRLAGLFRSIGVARGEDQSTLQGSVDGEGKRVIVVGSPLLASDLGERAGRALEVVRHPTAAAARPSLSDPRTIAVVLDGDAGCASAAGELAALERSHVSVLVWHASRTAAKAITMTLPPTRVIVCSTELGIEDLAVLLRVAGARG